GAARRRARRAGDGQPARPVPAREPARPPHAQEHGAVRRAGHAEAAGRVPRGQARAPPAGSGGVTAMPQTLTEERVDAPIGKIQVFRAGSGDPLVYLHSAGGEPTNPALEDRADSFAVTGPVFPGFGESEGIEQIDDMEDAVSHLL